MGKYAPLTLHLRASGTPEVCLTFSEIERILGTALPASAYRYRAWWANGGQSHADAWMQAGYAVDTAQLSAHRVIFRQAALPEKAERKTPSRELSPPHLPAQPHPGAAPRNHQPEGLLVCGYQFTYIQDLIPESENGKVKLYAPQKEHRSQGHLPLNPYGDGVFCRFSIQVPEWAGVYLWVVAGQIVYIGETNNLHRRFNMGYGNISPRNCYIHGQTTNCRMNKAALEYYRQGTPVCLYFLRTERYKQVEAELLGQLNTALNIKDN